MSDDRDRLRVPPVSPPGAVPNHGASAFGEQLRRFRRAAGLTQEQLAERAGLSVAGVSALERGAKASPQRETVCRLAEALALAPADRQRLAGAVAVRRPPNAARTTRPRLAGCLPPQPGPLIGRARELAGLAALLVDPACRLVTLVGPGGIGKTRLGIQAVADGCEHFADGVAFVALAPLRSADLLAPAIADALAVPLHGQGDPREQLLAALREREVLLVLDNFEHLLDGAALVAAILRSAPGVKLIVTSRERLNLREEWVVAIEGLGVPTEGVDSGVDTYDAVRLFVERARKVQARFAPEPAEWSHIAHICRLVGGMPLGIELAAAWVPVLPCAEIAREIAGNLDFLATAPRDAPERHRDMRAVFDHSWQLLAEQQRDTFRRLAVFRGGFGRAAAAEVAGASLFTLSALLGKSFLRRTPAGRYEIHELLRQYGEGRLNADPDEARRAHDRHCAYYVEFLAQREGQLRGREQQSALDAIDAELENVRTAWHWATEKGNATLIARAAEGLWLYLTGRGRAWEGEAAFARAVAALEAAASTATAVDTPREVALGMALARQASYQFRLGAYGPARALLARSVALFRRLDAPRELGFALNFLAATTHLEGNYAEEQRLLQESLALLWAAGDHWCAAYSLNDLGLVTHLVGDNAGAQRLARESIAIFEEFGDRRGIAFALNTLGEVAAARGDHTEAELLHRESLTLRRATSDCWGIAHSLNQLGIVARLAGAGDESRCCFLEALRAARAGRALPIVLDVLVELAILHAGEGDEVYALDLLHAALRHPARTFQTRDKGERLLARLAPHSSRPAGMVSTWVAPEVLDGVVDTLLQVGGGAGLHPE